MAPDGGRAPRAANDEIMPFGLAFNCRPYRGVEQNIVFRLPYRSAQVSRVFLAQCRFAFHDETIGSLPFSTLAETVVQGSATHVKLGWPIFALHVRLPDRFIDHNILA